MSDDDHLWRAGGYEWEEEADLTCISEAKLSARLKELGEEERAISYRRRVIQGRIDLIRAEFVRRGGVALSPEELACVLLGGEGRAAARGDGQERLRGLGGDG